MPKKKKRVRRSPEEARALILNAAKQVFAEHGPNKTHLKAVAEVAGVSHSLVTHYFGTVDALVEEVIEDHMTSLRESILEGLKQPTDPEAMLRMVFDALSDPLQGRLMAWALLSGRVSDDAFFARHTQGMRRIVDLLVGAREVSDEQRRDLENRIVMMWCATVGYSAGASVLFASLDVDHTPERDAEFLALLVESLNGSEVA